MNDLPPELDQVLPPDTARTWLLLSNQLPHQMTLYGGTALTARIQHRHSIDLDFFFHEPVDLNATRNLLESLGTFAVTAEDPDTLNGIFNGTKLQFLHARRQVPLEGPTVIAGIPVASLRDIAATKLKTIGDRGELRDYFDLMAIEQRTHLTVEPALLDYQARFGTHDPNTLRHLILALGSFSDVADDPGLPVPRTVVEQYWLARLVALTGSTDMGGRPIPPPPIPERVPAPHAADTSRVWVPAHERAGQMVRGYWRRR